MADRFIGTVALRGANGKVTPVRYALVDSTYAEAKTALDNVAAELAPLTNAVVVAKTLSFVYAESEQAGGGDIFERATVAVHINPNGTVDKFGILNIPAPVDDLFQAAEGAGRDVVNPAYAELTAYVEIVAAEAKISDGETINTDLGPFANGVKSGRRTLANVKLG